MDPALGRFTSRDPLGIWGDGANLGNGFTYCASNPWSLVDPFGLASGRNAALRQQMAELQDSRRKDAIWAGLAGFFEFGKEDALLATEGLSYIPIVGWGADAVLLSEAIARGDSFDTIMAGIGFIPILGDGAKAIVDTGGRVIRLGRGARVLDSGLETAKITSNVRQTGGRTVEKLDGFDWDGAELAYDQIRKTDDVPSIAGTTGMREFHVQRVKDHIF